MSNRRFLGVCRLSVALVCAFGLTGAAAYADMPDVVFQISAESSLGSATVDIMADWGDYDPVAETWSYEMPAILILKSGGTSLAYVDGFTVNIKEDPEVNLTFSVQAGSVDTTFRIASSLLTFPTINSPEGLVSAGYTVTDRNANGATLTGLADGYGYLAKYNGYAGDIPPQGTTFAQGLSVVETAVPFGTKTESFESPIGGGYSPIGTPVSSISSLAHFELSARDLGSGTSHFEVVPEPGALSLLVIGALSLLRRRQ